MNKKAVSPLIAYILLIGMVVAMSAIVGNFLIKQARDINFDSKEIEIYCADVALDAQAFCLQTTPINAVWINVTNRGYYNIDNLSIVKREDNNVNNLASDRDEFSFFTYLSNGDVNTVISPLQPEERELLKIAIDPTKLEETEFFITPIIKINEKTASCNEKVFKLSNIQSVGGSCPAYPAT